MNSHTKKEYVQLTGNKSPFWIKRVPFECQFCKKIIYLLPRIAKTRKFCSPECRHDAGKSTSTIEKMKKVHIGKHVGEKSGSWIDGRAWLVTLHQQIMNMKGKAVEYQCVGDGLNKCNKQARDWSNVDHSYSLNPDDYQPRCRRCHIIYDNMFNNSNIGWPTKYAN